MKDSFGNIYHMTQGWKNIRIVSSRPMGRNRRGIIVTSDCGVGCSNVVAASLTSIFQVSPFAELVTNLKKRYRRPRCRITICDVEV
jgi:hypothetical protein